MVFRTFPSGCKVRQVCHAWFSVHFRVAVRYARCAMHSFPYIFKHCLWPGGSGRLSQGCPDVVPRSLVWPSLASGRQRVVQALSGRSPLVASVAPIPKSGSSPLAALRGAHVQVWGIASWSPERCPDVVPTLSGRCPGPMSRSGGSHLGFRTSSRRCPCGMFCSSFLYRRSID